MINFRTKNQEMQRSLRIRVIVAAIFVLLCFGILLRQLWVLQVVRYQGLSERADRNRIVLVPIPPRRGDIYDRNGVVLAHSYRDYTIDITPSNVKDIKALVQKIGTIIPLTSFDIRRFHRRLAVSNRFDKVILKSGLTEDQADLFAVHSYEFPGASLRARWVREYPQGESAAHVIGYVGRISERDKTRLEVDGLEGNYRGTDIIGKKGIEASYEQALHGKTGWEEVEVSAGGRPVRVLKRIDPVPGDNLYLSIDMGLQKMIEGIYRNPKNPQKGAVVVIEPKTGKVLAYVSEPSYDPNLFVDGIDEENWRRLADDPDHPLIDRPISAAFPIGSTYKPFVALAALHYKVRDPNALIPDPGYYEMGNQRFRNAGGAVFGPTNMYRAITISSDTYFFGLGPLIGVDRLHDFTQQFGFGKKTGIDLEGEKVGVLPSRAWKKRAFRDPKRQHWLPGETVSVAVGQGYNAFTMMQLAQAVSTLANDGKYIRPHLVADMTNPFLKKAEQVISNPEYQIDVTSEQFSFVKKAMANVTKAGTARSIFANASYLSAGKTGTAQVFSLKGGKYRGSALSKHLRDHALYIGFAPVDNPSIAVAIIVEHGGWGASSAAPIARKIFDYWLMKNHSVLTEGDEKNKVESPISSQIMITQDSTNSSLEQEGNSPDLQKPIEPKGTEDKTENSGDDSSDSQRNESEELHHAPPLDILQGSESDFVESFKNDYPYELKPIPFSELPKVQLVPARQSESQVDVKATDKPSHSNDKEKHQ